MMRPNVHLMLAGALDFSLTDLIANRHGFLTDRQRQALQRRRAAAWRRGLAAAGGVVLAGWLTHARPGVMLLALGSLLGLLLALLQRFDADLQGSVNACCGRFTWQPGLVPCGTFVRAADGRRLCVPVYLRRLFDGRRTYRLYFTPATRIVLSAEPVS